MSTPLVNTIAATQNYSRLDLLTSVVETLVYYSFVDYAPINSKVQHPRPGNPRATPRAFELLKIGLFKFPSLGAKKLFKCPTN